ncbi:hypothetical protein KCP77_15070 [Salmonella enterica subsp. enterica]|nr:hypothetical protein KCP77_15070 [Salmonella enterica subsp. enterica]
MPTIISHLHCRVLKHLVGVGDIAMLIDQRITGVAHKKFDRHVELVSFPRTPSRVAVIPRHNLIASVGKDRNLGFTGFSSIENHSTPRSVPSRAGITAMP